MIIGMESDRDRPGIGCDGLVVPVELVHGRVVLLVDEGGGAHDDVFAVLREEAALPEMRKMRGCSKCNLSKMTRNLKHNVDSSSSE